MKRLLCLLLLVASSAEAAYHVKAWKPAGESRFILQCIADAVIALGPYWKAVGGGGAGVTDGDKGDITVASSGAAWTVDADAIALGTDTTGNYAGSSSEGGAATTATALAANGANCSAGSFPLGVDASGAAESCTVAGTIGGTLTATDDLLTCTDGTGGATIGACTIGNLDNLRLDGNTISTTNSNGDLVLAPNGTGAVSHPVGSATLPGISFTGDPDTGFYWESANSFGLGASGTRRLQYGVALAVCAAAVAVNVWSHQPAPALVVGNLILVAAFGWAAWHNARLL